MTFGRGLTQINTDLKTEIIVMFCSDPRLSAFIRG